MKNWSSRILTVRINEIGEFGLIDRIRSLLPLYPSTVIEGIGDDVAVLKIQGDQYLLATCDVQVENIHFSRQNITAYQLGRRTAAINLSDIGAVGGKPSWALVSLALPKDTEVSFVDDLYLGMVEELQRVGAAIVGGNLSGISDGIVIDFCLLGTVAPEHLLLRKGARVGDSILVTGYLGDSKAGLELIRRPHIEISEITRARLIEKHLLPQARLMEGQLLGRCGLVGGMLDVSDGLLADLNHLCGASEAGAELWVEKLPVSSECREAARCAGENAMDWALRGGEDYELLFTVPPDAVAAVQEMLADEGLISCCEIGRIVDRCKGVNLLLKNGKRVPASGDMAGWDHFLV